MAIIQSHQDLIGCKPGSRRCIMSSTQSPSPPDPIMVLSGRCAVTSLLCPQDEVLITGHQNGQLQEWSVPLQRATVKWDGHSDTVLWLAWEDGKLVSQGRDGKVKIWTKSAELSLSNSWIFNKEFPSAPLIFCNCAIINSSQDKLLAVPGTETSEVYIYEIFQSSVTSLDQDISISKDATAPIVCRLKPACVKGYGMCMKMCSVNNTNSSINGHLLVGYESGSIALWNSFKGQLIHTLRIHSDSIMSLSCWSNSSNGQVTGLSASVDSTIQCWKVSGNGTLSKEQSVSVINDGFNDLSVRKDGKIFISGGWDSRGRVFSLKKLRPLAVLTYHKESVNCVGFSPDNHLILGSKDGYISFWNLYKDS